MRGRKENPVFNFQFTVFNLQLIFNYQLAIEMHLLVAK